MLEDACSPSSLLRRRRSSRRGLRLLRFSSPESDFSLTSAFCCCASSGFASRSDFARSFDRSRLFSWRSSRSRRASPLFRLRFRPLRSSSLLFRLRLRFDWPRSRFGFSSTTGSSENKAVIKREKKPGLLGLGVVFSLVCSVATVGAGAGGGAANWGFTAASRLAGA